MQIFTASLSRFFHQLISVICVLLILPSFSISQNWETVRAIDFSDPGFDADLGGVQGFNSIGFTLGEHGSTGIASDKCAFEQNISTNDRIAMRVSLEEGVSYRFRVAAKAGLDNVFVDFSYVPQGNFAQQVEINSDVLLPVLTQFDPSEVIVSNDFTISNPGNYWIVIIFSGDQIMGSQVRLDDFILEKEVPCNEGEVDAGPDRTICEGANVTLGPGTDCLPSPHPIEGVRYCYSWEPSEGLSDPHSENPIASPTETTTYTVYVTSDQGALIGQDEVTVFVNELSDLSILPASPVLCSGSSITLSGVTWLGGDAYTYLWSTGETTDQIEVNRLGNYSVTITDQVTNCTAVSSVNVQPGDLDATITTDAAVVCDGVDANLSAQIVGASPSQPFSYYWSNGSLEAATSVSDPGEYSLTIHDDTNGCQKTLSINIGDASEMVSIEPANPMLCDGGTITLNTNEEFSSYQWSNGAGSREVPIDYGDLSLDSEISVTVTDENGCTASDVVTVNTDPTDPESIRQYFTSRGFYSMDISIMGDIALTSDPTSRFSLSPCERACEVNELGGCVQDEARKIIAVNGEEISDLAGTLQSFLDYFESEYGYTKSRGYITKNEDLCLCTDFIDRINNVFENDAPLAFWIHLFEADPEDVTQQDKLYLMTNIPSSNTHFPEGDPLKIEFLDNCLAIAGQESDSGCNTGSEAQQAIYSVIHNSLDYFTDEIPDALLNSSSQNIDLPLCEGVSTEALNAITPAGVPVHLPEKFVNRFIPSLEFTGIGVPDGALVGFTDFTDYEANEIARYYRGRVEFNDTDGDPRFLGYYRLNCIIPNSAGGIGDKKTFDSPFDGDDEKITLGYLSPGLPSPTESIDYYQADFIGNPPDYSVGVDGSGIVPSSFTDGAAPVLSNVIPYWQMYTYPVSNAPVTSIEFSRVEIYSVTGTEGIVYSIQRDDGTREFILAVQVDGEVKFFRWNCFTGQYEEISLNLSPAQFNQINDELEDEIITEAEDLSIANCFILNEDFVSSLAIDPKTPSDAVSTAANIINYAGLSENGAAIELLEDIIIHNARTYNDLVLPNNPEDPLPTFKFIVSADESLCPEGCMIDNAAAEHSFNTLAVSSDKTDHPLYPDAIFRIHFRADGRANFCVRVAEDLFTYSEFGQLGPNETQDDLERSARKLKGLMVSKIQKLLLLLENPESIKEDANPDLNPDYTAGPAPQRPMFSGLRPNIENVPGKPAINAISVSAEIIGVGKAFMRKRELPNTLWKADLPADKQPLFEIPEPAVSIPNTLIQENPVVGLVELGKFGWSFVNEKQVRQSMAEMLLHPVTAAQAFLKDKVDVYSGNGPDGEEGIYYAAGADGTSLIIGVINIANLAAKLRNLPPDVGGTSQQLKQEIGDLKDKEDIDLNDIPNDDFYRYFQEGTDAFTKADIDGYFEFIGKEFSDSPVDKRKLMTQPSLAVLWKKANDGDNAFCPLGFAGDEPLAFRGASLLTGCTGIDLKSIIRKFPDPNTNGGVAFWQKYEEVFINDHFDANGVLNVNNVESVKTFLKDIQDKGDDFLAEFVGRAELMEAWNKISNKIHLRKDPDILNSLTNILDNHPLFIQSYGDKVGSTLKITFGSPDQNKIWLL